MTIVNTHARRQFLKYLAASPLTGLAAWAQDAIKVPADAISIADFEAVARRNTSIAHWGYTISGVEDDITTRANVEAYKKIQLRPRRLVDVSKPDLKTNIFGRTWDFPIFICPTGGHGMYHPDAEVATARAAKAKNALQILSTVASKSIEEVVAARGEPVWYQLYAPSNWAGVETIVKRVEGTGCPVIALTVDLTGGRNTETFRRARKTDTRDCSECHDGEPGTKLDTRPMLKGVDLSRGAINPSTMDWAFVERLKKLSSMKLILKGIEAPEDAKLAIDHGVDGILVSNHGGRAMETGRSTIESLPEVIDAVNGRVPVFIDGGIRRGSDAYKALSVGARAVGIGRPYLWGLAAFGQAGVERVLDILRAELQMTMRQAGTPTIAQLSRSSVVMRDGRFW